MTTVVLLHASPLDERMWERSQVTDGYLAPRLYGLGQTMDEWATAVLESFSGPGIFAGASMGGYCAAAAARLAPDRIAGLVLAGSRPDADTPQRQATRDETIALARECGAQGIWEAMRDRADSTEAYRALGDRKLTIVGDRDPIVPVAQARVFDPDTIVLPGCGHLPSLERPAEFNELVREAIARWT